MSGGLVLLTGGAGFIGSNILAELSGGAAFEVAVCDRLGAAAEGKWRNLMGCFPVDLIAPEALWPWLARCGEEVETIIHMGAISSTTETDLDLLMETNFVLSRDLFDWCAEKRRRFIWASSAATYGDGKAGFEDGSEPNWLATLRPLNPYGWSKALFDLYAARRAARGHAPPQWAGLKFFNVYGPREGHKGEMASVAAKVWPDVAAGRPVRLFRSAHPDYDDGGQMRDFLFVGDAVRVVRWLLEHPETSGIFNVGTGTARSFADLVKAVFAAAGTEAHIEYVDMPPELAGRYQYFTQAPMQRLREAGYSEAFTSLETGIGEYVVESLSSGALRR